MGKIATEQEAYSIGKVGTPVTNKCCTKARAEALGCAVSGSYQNNQLVQTDNVSKKPSPKVKINITGITKNIQAGIMIRFSIAYTSNTTGDTWRHNGNMSTTYTGSRNVNKGETYTLSNSSTTYGYIEVSPQSFKANNDNEITIEITVYL